MNVTVIGAGYVGLSTAFLCAEQGHNVHIVDLDESRVRDLKNRYCYIDTPFFKELLNKHHDRLSFGFEHVDDPEIVFCCVSTPLNQNNILEMRFFESAVEHCPRNTVFVQRSTCMPDTASKYSHLFDSYIVMPEFLREKTAWADSRYPDRIVLGIDSGTDILDIDRLLNVLGYKDDGQIYVLDYLEAEYVKLVANSFLATKISFASMIQNICENNNCDANNILEAVGADYRIGQEMFRLDGGFKGNCLPKDTRALSSLSKDNLLDEVLTINSEMLKKNNG